MPRPSTVPADSKARSEKITGVIDRIRYQNDETGYQVLSLLVEGASEPVTVAGISASKEGERVSAEGEWVVHPKHGKQFKAALIVTEIPSSRDGLIGFLSSGMIKGLGPIYARKIVDFFGADTIDILDKAPKKLLEVPGIGPAKSHAFAKGWAEQTAVRGIMIFLQSHGISANSATRIYRKYGASAVERIKENPYILARDIRGIGFKGADFIALSMGTPMTAMVRLRAGVTYVLSRCARSGHCGMGRDGLVRDSARLLRVASKFIEAAIDEELAHSRPFMVAHESNIYIAQLVEYEQYIADRLIALSHGLVPWGHIDVDGAISQVQARSPVPFDDDQRNAIASALTNKVAVVTGGPGVGKTTILNAILQVVKSPSIKIALAAPTGKAAKRMAESTGMEAMTIHRLIGLRQGMLRNSDEPIDCDLIVLDESSMTDIPLMAALLSALPSRTALLIVGDVDQLASVGPGQVLADIIDSGIFPVVRLTRIHRQKDGSLIVENAHAINRGELPVSGKGTNNDFFFIRTNESAKIPSLVRELVSDRIPKAFGFNPMGDVQILCPMTKTDCGTVSMNLMMQALLNPSPAGFIMREKTRFGVGDRVMQTENNYDKSVFNGDTGIIVRIDLEEKVVVVDIDGEDVEYHASELDQLVLSYAMSIHKSQGSEFPVVIIPVTLEHRRMLARHLFYTAVTRGRNLVVLVGQESALLIAVRNDLDKFRLTRLRDFLVEGDAASLPIPPTRSASLALH